MSPDPAAPRARWHAAHARWQATRRRWRHSLKWRLVTLFLLLALAMTGVLRRRNQARRYGGMPAIRPPQATPPPAA